MNVTIDDQLGDNTTGFIPVYLPNDGTWHAGSPSEDCDSCKITLATLDVHRIHNHTWHNATHTPGLTPAQIIVNFTGTAVYVYNIVPNFLPNNTATFANISFTVDGADTGSFLHTPHLTTEVIQYNQLVHSITGLSNGPHTLVTTADGDTESLILCDYVLYTTESNDTATKSTPSTQSSIASSAMTTSGSTSSTPSMAIPAGAIIGVVLGGIALVLIAGVAALLLLRRRKAQKHAGRKRSEPIFPYHDGSRTEAYCGAHGLGGGAHPAMLQPTGGISVSSNPASRFQFGGGLGPADPNAFIRPSTSPRGETESPATAPGLTGTRISKRREVLAQRIDLLR
ncbi:hypothetical protein BD309DRAFT_663085 [Dichomitus squalens]|uniref:Uncharacterized protein n=1 Tax=Dichomitus squalens TaxID=114155 RepID=A0A4Q9NW96_9APHY|nr:hypothetical protein BD309DRAFT_663085 [Dichomitus squalens]TBU60316.1 hypothetical protein BD310DRAFT_923253 [Dichomitus squalens]